MTQDSMTKPKPGNAAIKSNLTKGKSGKGKPGTKPKKTKFKNDPLEGFNGIDGVGENSTLDVDSLINNNKLMINLVKS